MRKASLSDCVLYTSVSFEDWKRALRSRPAALKSQLDNTPGCWAINVLIGAESLVLFESIPKQYLDPKSENAILLGFNEQDAAQLHLHAFSYGALQSAVFEEAQQELQLSEAQIAHFRRCMDDVIRPGFTRAFCARSIPLTCLTLVCVRDFELIKQLKDENQLSKLDLAPSVKDPALLPLEQALLDTTRILRHKCRPLAYL